MISQFYVIPLDIQVLFGYADVRPKLRLITGYNRILNPQLGTIKIDPTSLLTMGAGVGFLYKERIFLDIDITNSSLGQGPPLGGNIRTGWNTMSLNVGFYL